MSGFPLQPLAARAALPTIPGSAAPFAAKAAMPLDRDIVEPPTGWHRAEEFRPLEDSILACCVAV